MYYTSKTSFMAAVVSYVSRLRSAYAELEKFVSDSKNATPEKKTSIQKILAVAEPKGRDEIDQLNKFRIIIDAMNVDTIKTVLRQRGVIYLALTIPELLRETIVPRAEFEDVKISLRDSRYTVEIEKDCWASKTKGRVLAKSIMRGDGRYEVRTFADVVRQTRDIEVKIVADKAKTAEEVVDDKRQAKVVKKDDEKDEKKTKQSPKKGDGKAQIKDAKKPDIVADSKQGKNKYDLLIIDESENWADIKD